jgi:hypothetical protein
MSGSRGERRKVACAHNSLRTSAKALKRSGWVCNTTLPAGRSPCSASFAGEQTRLRARTVPTTPGWWSAGLLAQTTAFASLPRDADALLGRSSPSASARQTTQRSARAWHQDRCRARPGGRKRPAVADQYPAYGNGWQSRAVPDRGRRCHLHGAFPTPVPVVHGGGRPGGGRILGDYTARFGWRSPFRRGRPICPAVRGGAGA